MRNLDGGAVAAATGALAGAAAAVAQRRPNGPSAQRPPVSPAAAALAVGALAGFAATGLLDGALTAGIVLAAAGGALLDRGTRIAAVAALGIAAAMVFEAASLGLEHLTAAWLGPCVAAVCIGGGALARSTDARRPEIASLLFAVSAAGAWATLPDTEAALPLLGAAGSAALAPLMTSSGLGGSGAFAASSLLAFTAGSGGLGRHAATVGAVAGLGVLVIEPFAIGIARRRGREPRLGVLPDLLLVGAQCAAVLLTARVAGVEHDAAAALPVAAATLFGLALFTACAATHRPRLP